MRIGNTTESFGFLSQFLHWLIALIIIALLAVGWTMTGMSGSGKFKLYGLHKSFGAIVLMLALLRVAWAMLQPKPHILGATSYKQKILASGIHALLYLWIICIPLSGWLMSNAAGYSVKLFGHAILPTLVDKSPEIWAFTRDAHTLMAFAGVALLIIHVTAALYHHIILKDDTLRRMLPKCRAPHSPK